MKQPELTREDEAKIEMNRTEVPAACGAWLITLFLSLLAAVFIFQYAEDLSQYFRGTRPDAVPQIARIEPLRKVPVRTFQTSEGEWADRLFEANRALIREIKKYETALENSSWLAETVLPPAQYVFTRFFRIGNEKVYCGRKGYLFYRPDVDYVAGRGFLDPAQLHRRRLADPDRSRPVEPDPLPAILQFNRELSAMGIRLIVMPVPAKPSLVPRRLYRRHPEKSTPQNPSYEAFAEVLRAEGVEVFDCLPLLAARTRGAYLLQDTHWLSESAEMAAKELARRVREMNVLPEKPSAGYTRREVESANKGDIAAMLRLPEYPELYRLEAVDIQQVLAPDRNLWTRDEQADVLLLGDSFMNIYSVSSMNWGSAAGFAEQLSYYLQRPLDRISFNDNGSFATRLELARRHAAGQDPLKGKKIVIWEFAARELAQGDWQRISIRPEAENPDR